MKSSEWYVEMWRGNSIQIAYIYAVVLFLFPVAECEDCSTSADGVVVEEEAIGDEMRKSSNLNLKMLNSDIEGIEARKVSFKKHKNREKR